MTTRHWLYFYDQGGNRTIKSEIIAQRQIHYTYDINDVPMYGSANNRLMFYATYNTSGRSSTLESTTDYYYNDLGNVTRVVTDKGNTAPGRAAVRLHVAGRGSPRKALAYAHRAGRSQSGGRPSS